VVYVAREDVEQVRAAVQQKAHDAESAAKSP